MHHWEQEFQQPLLGKLMWVSLCFYQQLKVSICLGKMQQQWLQNQELSFKPIKVWAFKVIVSYTFFPHTNKIYVNKRYKRRKHTFTATFQSYIWWKACGGSWAKRVQAIEGIVSFMASWRWKGLPPVNVPNITVPTIPATSVQVAGLFKCL